MKALLEGLRNWLFELPRSQKRLVSVMADLTFVLGTLWASFALRLENWLWLPTYAHLWVFLLTALATITVFIRLGLYRAVIRYISEKALMVVLAGVTASAFVLVISGYLFQAMVPRSVPVIYGALLFIMVAGTRFVFRSMINHPREKTKGRVLIVGTGARALQLHFALMQGTEFRPMGFVSLDNSKHKTLIAGFPVCGIASVNRAVREQGIQRVFLALEDNSGVRRQELIEKLEELAVPVQTVPSMSELVAGQARINDVRDLDIADLLGREAVAPDFAMVSASLCDKVILVTGAGGSIGSELCRQIVRQNPACMVLMEQSEYALYSIEKELRTITQVESLKVTIHPLLGSVVHRRRCEAIMRRFGVHIVYHAAAYKHVPLVEQNIIEGVQNNVIGTWRCAEAAIDAGVQRFVLISTDKAVRPTNVMGASKRLAELVLQGLARRQAATTFSIVRFGNVLGSSGSVVPLFRDQIRDGGPVTVTHPDIIRYFMTIPEAAQLVLQAGAMGEGGDVFVLEMGEPVKIADLARKMIHLMGLKEKSILNPDGDIEIIYTGLRPGEKLYEELLVGNQPMATGHPRVMRARERALGWRQVEALLDELALASQQFDCEKVLSVLQRAPTEYRPNKDIQDALWGAGIYEGQSTGSEHQSEDNIRKLPV
jgi:FlaA1/EpsC-like NDP-sugar epimerase